MGWMDKKRVRTENPSLPSSAGHIPFAISCVHGTDGQVARCDNQNGGSHPHAGRRKPTARIAARNSESESRPCCRHCMMRAKSFMVWHEGPATAGFGLWVTTRFCALLELAWVAVWKGGGALLGFCKDAKDAGRFAWFL